MCVCERGGGKKEVQEGGKVCVGKKEGRCACVCVCVCRVPASPTQATHLGRYENEMGRCGPPGPENFFHLPLALLRKRPQTNARPANMNYPFHTYIYKLLLDSTQGTCYLKVSCLRVPPRYIVLLWPQSGFTGILLGCWACGASKELREPEGLEETRVTSKELVRAQTPPSWGLEGARHMRPRRYRGLGPRKLGTSRSVWAGSRGTYIIRGTSTELGSPKEELVGPRRSSCDCGPRRSHMQAVCKLSRAQGPSNELVGPRRTGKDWERVRETLQTLVGSPGGRRSSVAS
jgi:hypothetical protein